MAFALNNLSVLSYANGFTLWHYKAGRDVLADVSTDGFFDAADAMLSAGDMMMVSNHEGGRIFSVVAVGDKVGVLSL